MGPPPAVAGFCGSSFPSVGLVVGGQHLFLVRNSSWGHWQTFGGAAGGFFVLLCGCGYCPHIPTRRGRLTHCYSDPMSMSRGEHNPSDAKPGALPDSPVGVGPAAVEPGDGTVRNPAARPSIAPTVPLPQRLPAWLVRNPLYAGWTWTGFWALLIVADEFVDLAGWTWYVFVGMAALPTMACTVAVLHATPRRHLKPQKESVLAHFFVRFLALSAAFMVWGLSVVASASISTTVQSLAGNSESAVTSLGFNLLLVAVPVVVSVLWMALIVRCAWFLRRLRGWRQNPLVSRLPKSFLRHSPQLRRVVVGLAHPGLLLVAGLGTSVLALFLGAMELTFNLVA